MPVHLESDQWGVMILGQNYYDSWVKCATSVEGLSSISTMLMAKSDLGSLID
jgi:hypothetical protein